MTTSTHDRSARPGDDEAVGSTAGRIDPDDLATALQVLAQLPTLDADDPDIQTVKRATGRMYKQIRKARRREARQPQVDHDEALLARTATGSPMRIDDETK
ncbi:MAG TPA: short-chain dehydrogenase, partial [Pedococcus sp.]|nr:short-chain dehydrogenase [Pedococcus sp.]